MKKPKVLILRTAGTNCDEETAFSFMASGAIADLVHINRVVEGEVELKAYQILALPGGFTYGDDVASGKILVFMDGDGQHDPEDIQKMLFLHLLIHVLIQKRKLLFLDL